MCLSVYMCTDVIEEGIEGGGLACDVGTRSEEQCRNVTVSSFDYEETFYNVSLKYILWCRTCYCMDISFNRHIYIIVKMSTLASGVCIGGNNHGRQKSKSTFTTYSLNILLTCVHAVPRVVDSHPGGISSRCSSGTGLPRDGLYILDMLVLWEVWRWLLTDAQS